MKSTVMLSEAMVKPKLFGATVWRAELLALWVRRSEGGEQMSNDKRWHDMTPDEQAVMILQISGTVNGLQFRVQDLEDAVKALQEKLDKRGD
jgi:hypothetical protein